LGSLFASDIVVGAGPLASPAQAIVNDAILFAAQSAQPPLEGGELLFPMRKLEYALLHALPTARLEYFCNALPSAVILHVVTDDHQPTARFLF
jgi:hypothetical protein